MTRCSAISISPTVVSYQIESCQIDLITIGSFIKFRTGTFIFSPFTILQKFVLLHGIINLISLSQMFRHSVVPNVTLKKVQSSNCITSDVSGLIPNKTFCISLSAKNSDDYTVVIRL
ncbi:Hypothetical_protein [Hexamita inflata]|uniref:Hypothetical_protein n=1 Tax=Hexamita inflata TaxID=28002 RepID=A0ABP1H0U6_9EUKA